jgi:hypothetical protein
VFQRVVLPVLPPAVLKARLALHDTAPSTVKRAPEARAANWSLGLNPHVTRAMANPFTAPHR